MTFGILETVPSRTLFATALGCSMLYTYTIYFCWWLLKSCHRIKQLAITARHVTTIKIHIFFFYKLYIFFLKFKNTWLVVRFGVSKRTHSNRTPKVTTVDLTEEEFAKDNTYDYELYEYAKQLAKRKTKTQSTWFKKNARRHCSSKLIHFYTQNRTIGRCTKSNSTYENNDMMNVPSTARSSEK